VKDSYDVIVSGGGPAGSFAGYLCARNGLRTLIVERKEIPRMKCCAGGVLERSLQQLGFPLPESVYEREIFGTALVHGERRFEFRSSSRLAVTVHREAFDTFLLKKAESAGAEVLASHETVEVKEHADRVTVGDGTAHRDARYLIIAEGANSRSARQVLGPYPPGGLAMGLASRCLFGSEPSDLLEFHLAGDDRLRMPFVVRGGLDGWMFPHRKGGNIGVGGWGTSTATLRNEIGRLMDSIGRANGGIESSGAICAHPIPVKPRTRFSSARCMAVGDAAGLASPMTGEGISYALTSGRLAAETVMEQHDLAFSPRRLRAYDAAVRSEAVSVLRAARWTSRWVQSISPVMDIDRLLEAASKEDRIIDASVRFTRGERDWTPLGRLAILRFLPLFFSSLPSSGQDLKEPDRRVQKADHGYNEDRP